MHPFLTMTFLYLLKVSMHTAIAILYGSCNKVMKQQQQNNNPVRQRNHSLSFLFFYNYLESI